MRTPGENLALQAATNTLGKFETPHYLAFADTIYRDCEKVERANEDAVRYEPDVGVVLADGMGAYGGGDKVSNFLVDSILRLSDELDITELDTSEAVETIRHELLPQADADLALFKKEHQLEENCGAVVCGILVARNDLIGFNAGDASIYRYRPSRYSSDDGMFSQLTREQGVGPHVTNYFIGEGRDMSGDPMRSDIVLPLQAEAGDRFLLVSDGFLGDASHQRIPEEFIKRTLAHAESPEATVKAAINLPRELMQAGVELFDKEYNIRLPYQGKCDDIASAALWAVENQEQAPRFEFADKPA